MFNEAGFKTTAKQVKDTKHRAKWKREFGTLFVIGKKIQVKFRAILCPL